MVYFVGAGSGAADLITVRGARLLKEADVVIWAGSLVNPELLTLCREGCEIHDSAEMTLEEIWAVMEEAANGGKALVRLHTGDISLYSAVREQLDALQKKGIPYALVPGVSSFSGASAALGKELTLPGVSQTVILTRMAGRTPVPERENIRELAAHGSTMVVFLSAGMWQALQDELLAGGYDPNTPAAIVYKATWPEESIYRCTVGDLAATGEASGVQRTALVLVGDALGNAYERSLLYHPDFSTLFREGKEKED